MKQLLITAVMAWATGASAGAAQDMLDRVVARVNGQAITLSDARAAQRLGLVEAAPGVDSTLLAVRQLVERHLILAEVARFAPPEPDPAALDAEVATLKARVGTPADLAALEKETAYGEARIREVGRDNLRIEAYLNQRFGSLVQPSDDDVGQYYRTHLDQFTKDGRVMPFAEAEPIARQRAATERRQALIMQWMRELHQRSDVVELYRPK